MQAFDAGYQRSFWVENTPFEADKLAAELLAAIHDDPASEPPFVSTSILDQVADLIQRCRAILFPAYFGAPNKGHDPKYLANQLSHVYHALAELLHSTACQDPTCSNKEQCEHYTSSARHTAIFMSELPRIRRELAIDVQAAYEGDPAAQGYDEIILAYPGFFATMVYRLAHVLYRLGVRLIPRLMTEYAHQVTGIDIHPGARIGSRFFIDHGTGVVIGETTEIGNNVKIYQGVTLGALGFPRDSNGMLIRSTKRHPSIEDDVTVYAGATILGGTTVVGKGSVIGGNVWLTTSVPPGSKVVHRPADEVRTAQR